MDEVRGLFVGIVDDAIVIRLPLDALPLVAECCPALYDAERDAGANVTDYQVFGREVLRALEHEAEDGTTLVHKMFDAALVAAIGDGAEGVLMPGDALDAAGGERE